MRIRYNPPLYDPDRCFDLLDHFSTLAFREGSDFTFALDEAQRYRLGTRGDYPPSFYLLLDEGRHSGIETIQVVRRPVQVPPIARGLADEVVSFRLNSQNDIRALDDYFGDDAEQVRTLEKYHYLHYVAGEGCSRHGPV